MHARGTGAAVAAILILALAQQASAQQRPPSRQRDHSLFFVTATVGLGDCDDYDCANSDEAGTGPFFGLGIGGYIRPIPWFAAGIDLHYNFMLADHDNPGHVDEAARYWLANLAVRGIIPLGRVEPWGGIGFGFAGWGHSWVEPDRDRDVSFTGPDFALSFGADVEIAEQWYIGGMMRFAFPIWAERCSERVSPGETRLDCDDFDQLDPEDHDRATDLLWYLGFTGRYDF